ncbi:class I SAM-dependent methyltransferase [Pseudonocardia alni]|uniref:class I SAM-dependent methyltransferase n=1 Tax=Pseudonocardia alni TaxID=33907 RepID=UPI000A8A689A|nr:class I SAM-dependent methyltransferase [Pseudonocardia sp. AL041005-10]
MADLVPQRMALEFDTVAGWTRGAVAELGPDHALPAACRGSASPAGLDWLVEACGLGPGTRLADVGGGTGGPAAWARRRVGADPVVVDPMPGACRTAAALFGLPTLVGAGDAVPLGDGSFPVCWCLGVLCTVEDKAAVLAELHRVLCPGGSLGLLVFVADTERPAGSPEGNRFPSARGLRRLLHDTGFAITDEASLTAFPPSPRDWQDCTARVEAVLDRDHGDDPRHAAAREQSDRIGRLIGDGVVAGLLVHALSR